MDLCVTFLAFQSNVQVLLLAAENISGMAVNTNLCFDFSFASTLWNPTMYTLLVMYIVGGTSE